MSNIKDYNSLNGISGNEAKGTVVVHSVLDGEQVDLHGVIRGYSRNGERCEFWVTKRDGEVIGSCCNTEDIDWE